MRYVQKVAFVVAVAMVMVVLSARTTSAASNIWAEAPLQITQIPLATNPTDAQHTYCSSQDFTTKFLKNFTKRSGNLISYTADTVETTGNVLPQVCATDTLRGYFGADVWAVEDTRDAVRLIMPIGSEKWVAPRTATTIVGFTDTAGVSAQVMSVNYNFRPEVIGQIGVKNQGSGVNAVAEKSFYVDSSKLANVLRYANGSPIVFDRTTVHFSEDGRYAALFVYKKGYVRYDMEQKIFTPFMRNTSAQNPGLKFSIGAHGDFVAVTANAELSVYSLNACTQIPLQSFTAAAFDTIPAACSPIGLVPTVRTACTLRTFSTRTRFELQNTQLVVDVLCTTATGSIESRRYRIATPAASTVSNEPEGYFALGDSFSSGEGDTEGGEWYEPGTDEQGNEGTYTGRNLCHVSRRSYPYLLAKQFDYLSGTPGTPVSSSDTGLFHSVACSGALIHNLIGGVGEKHDEGAAADFSITDNQYRYNNDLPNKFMQNGTERQINFFNKHEVNDNVMRLDSNPEVITIGIGGNDVGFSTVINSCVSADTCEFAQRGSAKQKAMVLRIAQNKHRLVKVYTQAKQAAPKARIYVTGYPIFFSDAPPQQCSVNAVLGYEERVFAIEATKYLNMVVAAAAQEAGVVYVDVENILQGSNLCSGAGLDTISFNGLTAGNDLDPGDNNALFEGLLLGRGICIAKCFGNESFHPNALGHQKYAEAFDAQTSGLTLAMPTPEPAVLPATPAYFSGIIQSELNALNAQHYNGPIPLISFDVHTATTAQGTQVYTGFSEFMPFTKVRAELHSDPAVLGEFAVLADGTVASAITLPDATPSGYHELHVYGIDRYGRSVDVYTPLTVGAFEGDFDGDGLVDSEDSCVTAPNANVDVDFDGIDDVCDEGAAAPPILSQEESTENKGVVSIETSNGNRLQTAVTGGGAVLGVTSGAAPDQSRTTLQATGFTILQDVAVGIGIVCAALGIHTVGNKNRKHYTIK